MGSRRTSATRNSAFSLTRREWTSRLTKVAAGSAVAGLATSTAQVTTTKPPEGAPAPAPANATPQQKLAKAYADVRQVSERLSKIEVPMDVEPAFAFRP